MNAKLKKVLLIVIISLFILLLTFSSGFYISSKIEARKYSKLDSEFKDSIQQSNDRINELTGKLETERRKLELIERRNTELSRLNKEQGEKLKRIIGTNIESGKLISTIEQEISEILNNE